MIDADMKKVVDRLNELDASLTAAALNVRQPDEKIGNFVPKRNVETWLHYLEGKTVDEDTSYPKGSAKNNLAFLHPDFTISLTDLQSQKSSK